MDTNFNIIAHRFNWWSDRKKYQSKETNIKSNKENYLSFDWICRYKDFIGTILTYRIVSGKFLAADVIKGIKDYEGKFVIKTVQGNNITASLNEVNVILTDEKGGTSKVIITDVDASNGVIHAIDSVVRPN